MKRSITVLLMLLVGTLCFAQNTAKQTPSKTITGTVTDARTGETLIGATIYDTLSHKGTVTNQHGRFSLTLPGQRAVLRISFVGYQLQFHPVSLDQNTRLNVQLEGSTTLAEVRIIGQRTPHVESSQASVIEIPVEQVQAIPMLFGETDVVKAVQLLPGVQNGSEGTAGMYVRGGGPDENLFLLDGVPMYNVNHLGGFFSAFNSDAVKNIQLYKGSFPARFGSRLASTSSPPKPISKAPSSKKKPPSPSPPAAPTATSSPNRSSLLSPLPKATSARSTSAIISTTSTPR